VASDSGVKLARSPDRRAQPRPGPILGRVYAASVILASVPSARPSPTITTTVPNSSAAHHARATGSRRAPDRQSARLMMALPTRRRERPHAVGAHVAEGLQAYVREFRITQERGGALTAHSSLWRSASLK
jgi:hypothetical protein